MLHRQKSSWRVGLPWWGDDSAYPMPSNILHIAIPTDNGLSLLTQQALPLAPSMTRFF
jgi:hypothetical protein